MQKKNSRICIILFSNFTSCFIFVFQTFVISMDPKKYGFLSSMSEQEKKGSDPKKELAKRFASEVRNLPFSKKTHAGADQNTLNENSMLYGIYIYI